MGFAPGRPADIPAHQTPLPGARRDLLWLAVLIGLSLAPHLPELGFHSDDWDFFGRFTVSADQSIRGFFHAVYGGMRMRPGEALYDAVLYRVFGVQPFGYQVVNAVVIVATGLLFYQVLRELGQSRRVSLAVPLLYAVLPHYSTNRIWYASFRAPLSILLYLVSLLAGLRSLRASGRGAFAWGALSILALLASGLCYEAGLLFFLLSAVLFAWRGGRGLAALTVGALGAVMGFKFLTSDRLAHGVTWDSVVTLVRASLRINGWVYGLALPRTVWRAALGVPRIDLVVAAAILAGSYWALERIPDPPAQRLGAPGAARLVAWGLVVTILGQVLFLTTNDVALSATGISNRVAIAWAAGIAVMMVGLVAWLATWAGSSAQPRLFAVALALLVSSALLVSARLTASWIAAYHEELRVLAAIRGALPTLPKGAVVLLDGECSYIGPGVVFESPWDLRGALWLMYGDSTVRADVVAPRLKVAPDGVHVLDHVYPYDRLMIFDMRRRAVERIPDAAAADAYFARFNPDRTSGCPRGKFGEGVRPF